MNRCTHIPVFHLSFQKQRNRTKGAIAAREVEAKQSNPLGPLGKTPPLFSLDETLSVHPRDILTLPLAMELLHPNPRTVFPSINQLVEASARTPAISRHWHWEESHLPPASSSE
jgi:hypothetical protein